jgi:hypothetical protein
MVLAVMGLALTALPDIVMQNEAGRMNTFFKLYNQAWPLLALSAALALSALVRARRTTPAVATAGVLRVATPEMGSVPGAAVASGYPLAVPTKSGSPSPATAASIPAESLMEGAHPARYWVPATSAAPAGLGAEMTPAERSAGLSFAGDAAPAHGEPLPASDGAPEGAEPPEQQVETSLGERSAGIVPASGVGAPLVGVPSVGRGVLWPEARFVWRVALAVLVSGAALFPIFGTYSHLQLRSDWSQTATALIPTGLDGAAFMRVLYPDDTAAIDWINAHIHGTPVLLTSDRGGYRNFAGKVTMFTGLPTVGEGGSWGGEEAQERYSGQARPQSQFPSQYINQADSGRVTWNGLSGPQGSWVTNLPGSSSFVPGSRANDVETIYNTPDPSQALALLHEYHVSYIYVGTAERGDPNSDENGQPQYGGHAGFDPAGLAKFTRMVAAGQLRVVYHNPGVDVFQVIT